jgi:transposase
MDMGPAYQKAVKECLPATDIVFDRFHVMQMRIPVNVNSHSGRT